jgi:selenocysteine lyase/cysteine desulfurase
VRRSWLPRLDKVRSLVAEIIGAQTDEVVMVPNATHGVNNVVTQIAWQDGDVILKVQTGISVTKVFHSLRHGAVR